MSDFRLMDKFVIRRPKAEINASHAQRHIVLQEISTDRISSTNIVKNEKVKKDVADANSMDDSWSKSDALKENCCDEPQRKMTPVAFNNVIKIHLNLRLVREGVDSTKHASIEKETSEKQ